MRSTRIRGAGPFGGAVVVVFLLGLVSAPLRICFSHHGHAHTQHAMHPGHGTSGASTATDSDAHSGAHDGTREGCECLGACQLETAPHLSLSGTVAETAEPGPADVLVPAKALVPAPGAPHAVPLARGPPVLA